VSIVGTWANRPQTIYLGRDLQKEAASEEQRASRNRRRLSV